MFTIAWIQHIIIDVIEYSQKDFDIQKRKQQKTKATRQNV